MHALDIHCPPPATSTILIVDDEPGNLARLGSVLQLYVDVMAATSGERALQVTTSCPSDLILLDVLMSDMNGYEIFVCLRDNPATRDIPVIFVTGLDSTIDEERGLALGAADYITKPCHPAIILVRVHPQLKLKHTCDILANQNTYLETRL